MKLTDSFERDLLRELDVRLGGHAVRSAGKGEENAYDKEVGLRSVILAHRRPSLLVQDNRFKPAQSDTWSGPLEDHRPRLDAAVLAVGRIELSNHPSLDWAGTGFLVRDDVVATNRHVATEFAEKQGQGFRFRTFPNGVGSARIDFLAEHDRAGEAEFQVLDILYVENDAGPDLAFLKIHPPGSKPLVLSTSAEEGDLVAVIGYPREDPKLSAEVAERIFQGIYDVKRLAPGMLTGVEADLVRHDGSTLAGNSGSVVLDVETGRAVALHFRGGMSANLAVPGAVIDQRLEALG